MKLAQLLHELFESLESLRAALAFSAVSRDCCSSERSAVVGHNQPSSSPAYESRPKSNGVSFTERNESG
jgi:hypothetical protein